ncbi:MAG TPA: hypothetical protein VF773_11965 [Verrucomicrobiae bacterium]
MSKTVELEVVSKGGAVAAAVPLKERRDRIVAYHTNCKRSAMAQVVYAFMAGLELSQTKEQLAHGAFVKWCGDNLPEDCTIRTAQNYMRFAEGIQTKLEDVSSLNLDRLQLTNGEIPEKQRNAVLKAVHEVTAGSTLTELYRELGIIKQPKKPGYTAPKELSPEEEAAALEEQANDHIDQLLADLELVDAELLGRAQDAKRKQLAAALIEKSKLIRSLKSGKSKKPAKKGK